MKAYTPTKLDALGYAQNDIGLAIDAHNVSRPLASTSNRYHNPEILAAWVAKSRKLRAAYAVAVAAVEAECDARGMV